MPVNDLAVMNNLNAPFGLYAGQKLKVPDLSSAPVRSAKPSADTSNKPTVKTAKETPKPDVKSQPQPKQEKPAQKVAQPTDKKTQS